MDRVLSIEGSDGYLSDVVPTHHSNAPSEVSQDFLASTKVLEKHFRDKYFVLRTAYEQRIKQLSEVIQHIYSNLCSDEVIKELKNDPSSSVYIPAHLNETMDRYLSSDRENYIHQLLHKLSAIEVDLKESKKVNQQYRDNIESLNNQIISLQQKYESETKLLKHNTTLMAEENEKLKHFSHLKTQEISILERSFEKNSRELTIIENIGKEEQNIRKELKQSLRELAQTNLSLSKENSKLKQELLLKEREVEESRVKLQEMTQQEAVKNKHIEQLMEKFEKVLEQENKDSEESLISVQEKMKNFRNKLLRELKHEKSVNKSFSSEIQELQHTVAEKQHEFATLKEQYEQLQLQLNRYEHEKSKLSGKVDDLVEEKKRWELKNFELEAYVKQLLDKFENTEKQHFHEKELLKERLVLEARKDFLSEKEELEKKALAQRIAQENHQQKLANDLKHSYFPATTAQNLSISSNVDPTVLVGDMTDEIALYQIIQRLTHEKQQILDLQQQELTSLQQKLTKQHQTEKLQLQKRNEVAMNELKTLLQNASSNIEKLKTIIQDHKHTIKLQQERISTLQETANQMNYQLLAWKAVSTNNDQQTKAKRLSPQTPAKHFREIGVNTSPALIGNNEVVGAEAKHRFQPILPSNPASTINSSKMETKQELPPRKEKFIVTIAEEKEIKRMEATTQTDPVRFEPPQAVSAQSISIPVVQESSSHPNIVPSNQDLQEARLEILELQREIATWQSSQAELRREIENLGREKLALLQDLNDTREKLLVLETNSNQLKLKSSTTIAKKDTGTYTDLSIANPTVEEPLIDENSRMKSQIQVHKSALKSIQEEQEYSSRELKRTKAVLQQIQNAVIQSIHYLKKEQYQLKLMVEQAMLTFEHEKEKTITNLQLQFKIIFKHYHDKNERKLKDLRVKISGKYSDEYKLLEERYINQINNLNKIHSSELERVHQEMVKRAVNFPIQNNLDLTSESNDGSSSLFAVVEGKAVSLPAFESTLSGVIQGLQDQEAISSVASNKLISLAKAHTEPSYAANAAARALIGEELESVMNKKLLLNSGSTT